MDDRETGGRLNRRTAAFASAGTVGPLVVVGLDVVEDGLIEGGDVEFRRRSFLW